MDAIKKDSGTIKVFGDDNTKEEYMEYITNGYGLLPIIMFVLAIICNFISIKCSMEIEKK